MTTQLGLHTARDSSLIRLWANWQRHITYVDLLRGLSVVCQCIDSARPLAAHAIGCSCWAFGYPCHRMQLLQP